MQIDTDDIRKLLDEMRGMVGLSINQAYALIEEYLAKCEKNGCAK